MICTNLNILYLQRWMCFDKAERFSLLLNDLEGSMKLHPGKYPPENCLGICSPIKIPTMNTAPWENLPCGNSSGNNCRLYLKSRRMKKKASGIVIL